MKKQLLLTSILLLGAIFLTKAQTFVNGNISSNTTWTVANSPYVVNGSLTVDDNITLTIEPGVIVKFIDNVQMTVSGALVANGTQNDTIYFTSYKDDSIGGDTNGDGSATSPSPGDWRRIYFSDADAGTSIDFCRFKYAGRATSGYPLLDFYNSNSPVSISNSLVELCTGEGINTSAGSETVTITNVMCRNNQQAGFSLLSNTTIQNCTSQNNEWGYSVYPDLVDQVANNNTSQNNGHENAIYINGGNLTTNATWPGNQQYIIFGDITVTDPSQLTVEPGAIIKFNSSSVGLTIQGVFVANGTQNDTIYFTSYKDDDIGGDSNGDGSSSTPSPGDWEYLNFSSANAGTSIDYCRIKYGGHYSYAYPMLNIYYSPMSISNSLVEFGNGGGIATTGNEAVGLTNVICRNNVLDGFYLSTNTTLQNCTSENNRIGFYLSANTGFQDCTSQNNEWGFSVLPDFVHQTWTNGNTSINNGHSNAIFVRSGNFTSNTTWIDEYQYVLDGTLSIADGSLLSLEPGVIIKFYQISNEINVYGALVADGTQNDTIYFTSYKDDNVGGDTNEDGANTTPSKGDWRRVYFNTADVGTNLNYCRFKYGGFDYYNHSCLNINNSPMSVSNTIVELSDYTGIRTDNNSSLSLTNVMCRDNDFCGFEISESSGVTFQNCSSLNNQWGFAVHNNIVHQIWGGNNTSTGNGHQNAIRILGGNYTSNTTWIDEYQYVIYGNVNISDGYSLMLEPGIIMKFDGYYEFNVYGTLLAEGTPGDTIYFTSYKDDSVGGDTNDDADNTLPSPGNWENIYLNGVDMGTQMGHCRIKYARYGIQFSNSPMTIYNTIVEFNSTAGIYNSSSNSPLILTDVTSRDNSNYGIYSNSEVTMEDCQIYGNAGDGFNYTKDFGVIENCTITDNGRNFYISPNIVKPLLTGNNNITGTSLFDLRAGTIFDDAIWDSDFLYICHGNFILDDNTSLILEPGLVMKFDGHVGFEINGSLIAQGSSAEKIVFTSFKNDSYGGDSNNNGFNNLPEKGDWRQLYFNEADTNTILNWVIVSYAGYSNLPAVQINNSDLEAENILVIHNQDEGIYCSSSAMFDIQFSDIYDNNFGLKNDNPSYTVQAQNNWWGDLTGPYHATLNPAGQGNAVSDYVDFEPFRDNEGSIDNPWAVMESPATTGQYFDVAPLSFGNDDFKDLVGATDNNGLKFFERTNMLPWIEIPSPVPTGNFLTVCAHDLNNDGMTDIVAGGANGVKVLIHDQMCGADTCWTVQELLNGLIAYNIYVDHINSDSYPDLAVALGNNSGLRIIYGQSDGSWVIGQKPDSTTTFHKIRSADFNQDGFTDIVATNIENAGIQIWYSDQAGGWVEQAPLSQGYAFWGLDVADVDFNGYPDIVTSGNTSEGGVLFYLNQGDDTFLQSNSPTSSGIYNDLQLKDMNGDGYFDMASANQGAGIQTWLGNANLYWNYWYHPLETSTFKSIEIEDMTLDLTPDIIAASQSDGIKIWSNRTPPVNVNPVFATSEDEIEFGEVLVTYSKTELFTIQNISSDTAENVIIYATNPIFQVYEDTSVQILITPFDLLPGESKSMKVTYSPTAAVDENEGLIIHSIPEILMIPLTGSGVTQGVPEWTLGILVENNLGGLNNSETLEMGVGVGATDTLDFPYGEVNLPPTPPVEVFDARWQIAGYEGFLKDIRAYEENDHEYIFHWQAGNGGYPVTISWDPAQLPDGTFVIHDLLGGLFVDTTGMDTVNQLVLPAGIAAYPYLKISCHLINNANQIFQLDDGWNLVSLPVVPDYNEVDSLFTNAISAFWFDPYLPGYDQVNSLDAGKGYWLDMSGASTQTVIGNRISQLNIDLKHGWNLAGTILETVDVDDISVNPAGSLISVFGFDGSYYNANTLISGNGYWMEVSQDCQITISQSSKENTGKPYAIKDEILSNDTPASDKGYQIPIKILTGSIQGITNQSSKMPLTFGVHPYATYGVDHKLGELNLPPWPPAEIFEARFELDMSTASRLDLKPLDGSEKTYVLKWQAEEEDYPVILTWNKKNIPQKGTYTVSDAYGGILINNVDMREINKLEIPASMNFIDGLIFVAKFPTDDIYKDAQDETANSFDIEWFNAYPNPFFSSTNISYEIAETTSVSISILNKSGQTVWSFTDNRKEAGVYSLEWNGTDNSGNEVVPGMYFCNIRTGKANKVIKLIVLK